MTTIAQRTDIGAALDFKKVEIKAWGGNELFIRELTGRERDDVESTYGDDKQNTKLKVIGYGWCTDTGEPMFKPSEFGQINDLQAAGLEELARAIMVYNRMIDEDKDKKKDSSLNGISSGTS